MQYADNVHKGFATSLSIVVSSILDSILFDDVNLNASFSIGSVIVICSTFIFFTIGIPVSVRTKAATQMAVAAVQEESCNSPKPQGSRGLLTAVVGAIQQYRWDGIFNKDKGVSGHFDDANTISPNTTSNGNLALLAETESIKIEKLDRVL